MVNHLNSLWKLELTSFTGLKKKIFVFIIYLDLMFNARINQWKSNVDRRRKFNSFNESVEISLMRYIPKMLNK
jgi:hypothetical protein